jgi:hypothetical protein
MAEKFHFIATQSLRMTLNEVSIQQTLTGQLYAVRRGEDELSDWVIEYVVTRGLVFRVLNEESGS